MRVHSTLRPRPCRTTSRTACASLVSPVRMAPSAARAVLGGTAKLEAVRIARSVLRTASVRLLPSIQSRVRSNTPTPLRGRCRKTSASVIQDTTVPSARSARKPTSVLEEKARMQPDARTMATVLLVPRQSQTACARSIRLWWRPPHCACVPLVSSALWTRLPPLDGAAIRVVLITIARLESRQHALLNPQRPSTHPRSRTATVTADTP